MEWNSVNAAPKHWGEYIICVNGSVEFGKYNGSWYELHGHYGNEMIWDATDRVTHWMELPNPPEGIAREYDF